MENKISIARLVELATFKPSGANTVNSASREEWQEMARSLLMAEECKVVARAALDYIDAIPHETADSFPVMPGFDREWAENVLAGGVPDDVMEQAAPIDRRFMVDMSAIELPAVEKWRTPEAVRAQYAYRVLVEKVIADAIGDDKEKGND